uniref:Chitin-binding type-2 domain-containing protein n=1 Tax=Panagrolaimus davidi TaxID=227884 RepID=A0A914PM97_9BILA
MPSLFAILAVASANNYGPQPSFQQQQPQAPVLPKGGLVYAPPPQQKPPFYQPVYAPPPPPLQQTSPVPPPAYGPPLPQQQQQPPRPVEDFCQKNNLNDGYYGQGCKSHYFACSAFTTTRLQCPQGLFYDPETRTCDHKNFIVACGGTLFERSPRERKSLSWIRLFFVLINFLIGLYIWFIVFFTHPEEGDPEVSFFVSIFIVLSFLLSL